MPTGQTDGRQTVILHFPLDEADAELKGWCAGLLWQACMQVYRVGIRTHLVDIYNATDFFMLKFYMASLVLRRLADLKVTIFTGMEEEGFAQTAVIKEETAK